MQIRSLGGLLAIVLLACGGCTSVPDTAARTPTPAAKGGGATDARALADVLSRYRQWHQKPVDEQRQEVVAAGDVLARDRGDAERVVLALMLSTPGTPFRDDTRALALLAVADPGNAPLLQFAQVLQQQIGDRMRQVKDEQKRGDELAQKLEALRAIERSIVEREQRARVK
jgi:hypothetical protein